MAAPAVPVHAPAEPVDAPAVPVLAPAEPVEAPAVPVGEPATPEVEPATLLPAPALAFPEPALPVSGSEVLEQASAPKSKTADRGAVRARIEFKWERFDMDESSEQIRAGLDQRAVLS